MKRILSVALLLSLGLMMACSESTIEEIVSKSPDGDKTFTITGSKNSPLAPIMVHVHAQVKQGEIDWETELASDQMTSENVTVIWNDNRNGYIEMVMRDGEKKFVDFTCTDDKVHFVNRLYN